MKIRGPSMCGIVESLADDLPMCRGVGSVSNADCITSTRFLECPGPGFLHGDSDGIEQATLDSQKRMWYGEPTDRPGRHRRDRLSLEPLDESL